MDAKKRRMETMKAKGYFDLTPEERQKQLEGALDALKKLGESISEEAKRSICCELFDSLSCEETEEDVNQAFKNSNDF